MIDEFGRKHCDGMTQHKRPCRATPWESIARVGGRELHFCYHHWLAMNESIITTVYGFTLDRDDVQMEAVSVRR